MRIELSSAARDLFVYYCVRRNRKSGGFKCPVSRVLAELPGMKRSAYFGAKKELLGKKWIEAEGDFITPIRGFKSPETRTTEEPESPDSRTPDENESPENRTDSPEIRTTSPENRTGLIRNIPATIPATLNAEGGEDVQSNEIEGVNQNEPEQPEEPKTLEKPKSDHQLGMDFLWDTVGPCSDAGGQGNALSWMLENGFTLDEIKHYLPIHVREYDGKGYRPTYLTLQKVIGHMKRRNPYAPPSENNNPGGMDDEAIFLEVSRADVARHQRLKAERMNGGQQRVQ